MGKREIAIQNLGDWFERQKRVLPWRDDPSFYRVWISEIMLQQTQVITVVPFFERFVKALPTVEALAEASEESVMLLWAGLGYYSRARNLLKGAKIIVARGSFPKTREEWLEIPGVGQYTAGAILSIAMNQPEAILDGNVERVLSRWQRITRAGGDGVYKEALWALSRELVAKAYALTVAPSVFNQALMELGATLCTPKKPKCLLCPVRDICEAQAEGVEEDFPPRKKAKEWITIQEELHCLIDGEGRVLLRKREKGEWRAGLWDLLDRAQKFPHAGPVTHLGEIETKHVVTRHKIFRKTHVWKYEAPLALKAAEAHDAGMLRWISETSGGSEVAMGSALKRTLQMVRERFPEALKQN